MNQTNEYVSSTTVDYAVYLLANVELLLFSDLTAPDPDITTNEIYKELYPLCTQNAPDPTFKSETIDYNIVIKLESIKLKIEELSNKPDIKLFDFQTYTKMANEPGHDIMKFIHY